MANYSFRETLRYFSEKLQAKPLEVDLEKGVVELVIDDLHVLLAQEAIEGCFRMRVVLGLMLQPIREEGLKELAVSNFLGINTGGCTLAFDTTGVSLSLVCHTTCGTTPQENWEWLHRIVCVAREWNKVLTLWDEFVPLSTSRQENNYEPSPNRGHIYKG